MEINIHEVEIPVEMNGVVLKMLEAATKFGIMQTALHAMEHESEMPTGDVVVFGAQECGVSCILKIKDAGILPPDGGVSPVMCAGWLSYALTDPESEFVFSLPYQINNSHVEFTINIRES